MINPELSYHSPLLVDIVQTSKGGERPFRFFNHLENHPMFKVVVEDVWRLNSAESLKQIRHTLKLINVKLKELYEFEFKGVKEKIIYWRNELDQFQEQIKH